MKNEIIPFYFKDREVRVIQDEAGNPWWVAKDVCDVLDYTNPSKTIADHLDNDERSNISLDRGGSLLLVNESGLYTLIVRSNKPEARPFRKWVTSEVLPSIRRTGFYSMADDSDISSASSVEEAIRRLGPDNLTPAQRIRLFELVIRMASFPESTKIDMIARYGELRKSFHHKKNGKAPVPDHLERFIDEKCFVSPDQEVFKDYLYGAYCEYSTGLDVPPLSREHFFRKLYSCRNVRVSRARFGDARRWKVMGICLKN